MLGILKPNACLCGNQKMWVQMGFAMVESFDKDMMIFLH